MLEPGYIKLREPSYADTRAPDKYTENDMQFSPDEMRVLKECQHEAIVGRGLPLGGVTMAGCYYLMKIGTFKFNPINIVISGVTGFVFGTLSYRRICMEKIMALPNSSLKEKILSAQGKLPDVRKEMPSQNNQSQSWFDNAPTEPTSMTSSLDIEPYNQTNRFGDLPSASADSESIYAIDPPLQPIVGKPYTTYDDLRRSNREKYETTRNPGSRLSDNIRDTMKPESVDPYSPSYNPINSPSQPPKYDDFMS